MISIHKHHPGVTRWTSRLSDCPPITVASPPVHLQSIHKTHNSSNSEHHRPHNHHSTTKPPSLVLLCSLFLSLSLSIDDFVPLSVPSSLSKSDSLSFLLGYPSLSLSSVSEPNSDLLSLLSPITPAYLSLSNPCSLPFSTTSQPCSVAPPSASFPLPRPGSNSAVILLVPSLSIELNRAQPYIVVPRSVASLFLLPYAPLNPCPLSVHSAQSSPQPTSDLN
ncbi:hypothetical protein M0R45_027467 [Rubus argutus]|uniref:Uncharacterized protein n=1 Tax=Rubus argutus TaxID=59490 RepID=A0AAW1X269_RUBAR